MYSCHLMMALMAVDRCVAVTITTVASGCILRISIMV
jgi:hypothetical protein